MFDRYGFAALLGKCMKKTLFAIVVILASSAPGFGSNDVTGTWKAASIDWRWTLVLKQDNPVTNGRSRVIGAARACGSGPMMISDASIDKDILTLKCVGTVQNEVRIITLVGKVKGDEIEFTWELQGRPFPNGDDPLFGSTSPNPFVAKRVPDGSDSELAGMLDLPGAEFAAAVNLVKQDLKGEAWLFVPAKVRRVRAVLVVIRYGLGV